MEWHSKVRLHSLVNSCTICCIATTQSTQQCCTGPNRTARKFGFQLLHDRFASSKTGGEAMQSDVVPASHGAAVTYRCVSACA